MAAAPLLPNPLVPRDLDVHEMTCIMLDTERLMSSELWALSSGDEFKAAVALWCRAWKQTPAASLPSDERVLASWAGVPVAKWKRIRTMAMRGFVRCSDDRFYHRVLATDALRAEEKRRVFRERGAKGNAKRWGNRDLDRGSNGDGSATLDGSHKDRLSSPSAILGDRPYRNRTVAEGDQPESGSSFQDRARDGATANGQAQDWDEEAPFSGEAF